MLTVKIEVIVNSGSGPGARDDLKTRLEDLFTRGGAQANILFAKNGEQLLELAQTAAENDCTVVVAGGGDGTINTVAAQLVNNDKALGVLPLGTMNHFAKDLNIPLELDGAVQTIIAGHVTNVDLGEVNGRIFVNNSSLGLYPSIVREREKKQRLGSGKWPAYMWAAVAVLRRYPFLDIRLNIEGRSLVRRTPFVFIGNNEYEMETLNVGGRACIDAGELSLYVTNRTGRLGLFRLALRALLGGLKQDKDFLAMCTKEIWIGTKHKRIRVALDGEVTVMEPPLHYRVLPLKLRVLAPAREKDTSTPS
ncbi:MAG TPA: diacylglycerol kinase family protein [Pyrinomonadaceae bacterium]|nr:diacylglycerol kinase family protein [Pyrinomonadaceae bacterium]